MNQTLITCFHFPLFINVIHDFCQRWNGIRFALFGSVLREDFHTEGDIDVLVTYQPGTRLTLSHLIDMSDELEALFKRNVDFIDRETLEASRNYLRRQIILESARVIYAA